MQSFFQYRKQREAVKAQYERDRAKFDAQFPRNADPEKQSGSQRQPSSGTEVDLTQNSQASPKASPENSKNDGIERHDIASSETKDIEAATKSAEPAPDTSPDPETDSDDDDDSNSSNDGWQDNRPTLSRTTTQQSHGVNFSRIMTGIQVRKKTTREGGSGQVFIVDFEGPEDPLNPHNWSNLTRWTATLNIVAIAWIVGFASSVDSGALKQAAADFGVSEVAESLATGLFLIGFGFGALAAGPMSEEFGRSPVYIVTLALYSIFIMASALSPNFGAQLAFRFIAGFFGATPLACAGGSISDLWSSSERVFVFPIFANAGFQGPVLGPLVGGFIGQSSITWRWCEWVTLIASGAILANLLLFQPETYPPVLLSWRAAHLREITGDDRFRAAHEVRKQSFLQRFRRALYRPFLILAQEPIAILFGLYLTIIYIILFTFLNGFTFIFSETYGFSQGITGLCFLTLAIGFLCSLLLVYPIYRNYMRKIKEAEESGQGSPRPEERLWFAMIGAPFVPISIFWMGWTAYPEISYWSCLVAGVVCGFGILCVFISTYQYLIDTYALYSASALAAVTVVRYVAAGGMIEVSIPMYGNLGVHYTLTILGGLSAIITPAPYLCYIYGDKIRSYSKFARSSTK